MSVRCSKVALRRRVRRGILHIWQVMRECTQRGMEAEGILPGGLKVRRRARKLAARLQCRRFQGSALRA